MSKAQSETDSSVTASSFSMASKFGGLNVASVKSSIGDLSIDPRAELDLPAYEKREKGASKGSDGLLGKCPPKKEMPKPGRK